MGKGKPAGLCGDLKVCSLLPGGRSTKLCPLCAPTLGRLCFQSGPVGSASPGLGSRGQPPCSSLARTTSVPLIWSPPAPSSLDKTNRRTQMRWPCASWPLEAFLEVGRRLGTVDHCISRIPGPATPAQNSNIPSKHLAL